MRVLLFLATFHPSHDPASGAYCGKKTKRRRSCRGTLFVVLVPLLIIHPTDYLNKDIQSKKQRPGIFWKLQSHSSGQPHAVQESATVFTNKDVATLTSGETASSVLPQKPKNVETPAESRESFAKHKSPGLFNLSRDFRAADAGSKGPSSSIYRKYHLSHDSYPSLKRQPSFTSGIRKRQRPTRDHLAVFVESERGEELIQRTIREHSGVSLDKSGDPESQVNADSAIRKRPNVNAAERAWRLETWGKQNAVSGEIEPEKKDKAATSWDAESMEIAQELQQIALEQSRAAPKLPTATTPKIKPKPPGPRRTTEIVTAEDDISNQINASNLDEDGDYIIDTYIRTPLQTFDLDIKPGAGFDPVGKIDTGKIGILVIEEDQEKLWEDFGDEDQSEVEFESDEEDENGTALPISTDLEMLT